jgi:hypothetical protein
MRIPAFVLFILIGSAAMANAATGSGWRYLPDQRLKASASPFTTGSGATDGMTASQAVYLRRSGPADRYNAIGVLDQTIPLEAWRGKRVRLTVRLKNEGAAAVSAFAFIRKDNHVVINAVPQRLASGDAWQSRQFVLDVPENATYFAIQARLSGDGTLWADSVMVEATGTDIALTPSRRVETGGPLPGDNGPITPPWISGDQAAMASSWAPPVMEARH